MILTGRRSRRPAKGVAAANLFGLKNIIVAKIIFYLRAALRNKIKFTFKIQLFYIK